MERHRLQSSLKEWCDQNGAELEHDTDSPLGERFEVRWTKDDPTLIRFIDVYPEDANRITIQKGVFDKVNCSEEVRAKGTIYYRTVDQVGEALSQLKPFTDRMSRAHLRELL
jgi:hypothetical protein